MSLLIYFSIILSTIILSNLKLKKIESILGFLLVFLFSGFATYTPDWLGYEGIYDNEINKEFVYNVISVFFRDILNMEYQYLHIFYAFFISILYIYFIRKFTNNVLLVIVLHFPILFLFQITQIRFYLAFYLFCLGGFYLFTSRKKYGVFLVFLALLSHTSILFVLPGLLWMYFSKSIKQFKKGIFLLNILLFVIWVFGNVLVSRFFGGDSTYFTYLEDELSSSFSGAVFRFLPYFILTIVIEFYKNKILPLIEEDKLFWFLYKFSLVPMSLVLISLSMQIMGQRFIISGYIFQILLLVYLYHRGRPYYREKLRFLFSFFVTGLFWYHYYLPNIILSDNSVLKNSLEIIYSNKFF